MSLYVHDLPKNPRVDILLYCIKCGEGFSATRGDYFAVPPDEPLAHCGYDMVLVKRQVHIVGVEPGEVLERGE